MQAIILKKIPVKEYDELIVCYTPDFGKATYVAKSIRYPTSKQTSHLDILTLTDFETVQKNSSTALTAGALASQQGLGQAGLARVIPIITNANYLNSFSALKGSLPALIVAHYLLEIFDKFVFEQDPDWKLWQFLNAKLLELDTLGNIMTCDVVISEQKQWGTVLNKTQQEISRILGYNETVGIEDIIQFRFASLAFAREVLFNH